MCSYSYYKLQPQEEKLLARVLGRDDTDLWQHDPFDTSTVDVYSLDTEQDDATAAAAGDAAQEDGHGNVAAPAVLDDSCCTVPAAAAGGAQAGPEQQGSRCVSGRPSSEGSSRSVASGGSSKPKHTLAEIDALLQVLQADYCVANGPGLGSSRPSIATVSSTAGRLFVIIADVKMTDLGLAAFVQDTQPCCLQGVRGHVCCKSCRRLSG
jgi:hypothetical protein